MTIKSDKWIKWQCSSDIPGNRMINPFVSTQIRQSFTYNQPIDGVKIISYGVSSYGYDIRLAPEMKLFTNAYTSVIDPKNFDEKSLINLPLQENSYFILPANHFALGRSIEYFKVPRNVLILCLGKSTYARCGLVVNFTPFEPEWEGYVTIEFSNTTSLPMKIYANEGIAQVLFFESDEECEVSYADRKGKYQGQTGITLPKG